MLVFASLNTVLIHSYPTSFFKAGKLGFWSIFYKHFTVSGFDAYSYIFLSNEKIYFELSRHPLFGALLYPGACLNDWLMGWTHHNCATFIMAVMLVISATFSAVFFFRICRELIQLCRLDAYILTAFFSPCLHHAHHDGTRSFLLFHALSAGQHLYGGNLYGAGQTAQGMAS